MCIEVCEKHENELLNDKFNQLMLKESTLIIKGTLSIVISLGNFFQIVKTKNTGGYGIQMTISREQLML